MPIRYVISFTNKFNIKRQGDKPAYNDAAQAKDNQIQSLCLSVIIEHFSLVMFVSDDL